MTLVVLSPHLDDAVLSAGGALASAPGALAVTVFTEGKDAETRRKEDEAALALLGARALHLGLLDAPERLRIPRALPSLTGATVAEADLLAVVAVLERHVLPLAPARVLAPLGVGRHVDHRVVFEAARRVFPDVGFYEDRPYAYEAGATARRLAELSPLALTATDTTYDATVALRVRAAIDAYTSQRELLATWFPAPDDHAAYVERTFTR